VSVTLERLVQVEYLNDSEFLQVNEIAKKLHNHLCLPQVYKEIDNANSPGKSSSEVQGVFLGFAEKLGFQSEKKGLFANHPTSGLRPDYFLKTINSGILLEVERGKTTMNNMDLLDLWKCHICSEANYLFLMVPKQLSHNKTSKPYSPFTKVVNRMTPFFRTGNYTNVRGLFIYGY